MSGSERITRAFGLWDSPISPVALSQDRKLDAPCWDSDGMSLVWLEGRSGRGVLVAEPFPHEAPRDLNAELDVRAEMAYGGGDFTVANGSAYFVAKSIGRIYKQPLSGGQATALTPEFGHASSPTISRDGRWLMYLHCDNSDVDRLAVADAHQETWPVVLHQGHDFYMQPRWSPDGQRVAFIAWDHPQMPWDGTILYLARVRYGDGYLPQLYDIRPIAGGSETAIFQPEFSPDGRELYFISDETGWGRLTAYDLESRSRRWLSPEGIELGTPAWVLGLRTYAVSLDGAWIAVAANDKGFVGMAKIEVASGSFQPIEALAEYTDVGQVTSAPDGSRISFVASSPTQPPRVIEHHVSSGRTRIVARSSGEMVPAAQLARCEPVEWTTAGGESCYGLYYAPASDRFQSAGLPPLVVSIHGGPTSQVRAGWRAEAQFFATRGYAVLFVNYRGSTGYGRSYMLKLRNNWGICDVEDAVSGAQHLIDVGKVDPRRTIIMGGSAGGFTVLETMCRHPEVFSAGICMYGVADMFHLASDTHKFESRYLDSMLGPLPEAADVYRERSPVFHAQQIKRPIAVYQGDIDRVVPKQQSDVIVEALRRSGTPHEYHVYEGEGHGWRKRETIEHFYRSIDSFLRRHVLFA